MLCKGLPQELSSSMKVSPLGSALQYEDLSLLQLFSSPGEQHLNAGLKKNAQRF